MRFARLGNQVIAFSRVQVKIGGRGKVERVKLFTASQPIARIPPEDFQAMVQDGTVDRLDLPPSLLSYGERLSDQIGEVYTPQQALAQLQQKLQDHATTLSTDAS